MLRGNYIPVNGVFYNLKIRNFPESEKALGKNHYIPLVPFLFANGIVDTIRKATICVFNPSKPDCGCKCLLAAMAGLFVFVLNHLRFLVRQPKCSIIFAIF